MSLVIKKQIQANKNGKTRFSLILSNAMIQSPGTLRKAALMGNLTKSN